MIDQLGHRLLEAVAARGVKRLVIDGLSAFFEAAVYPERVTRFFSCLANELRRRGVTVLLTLETRDAVGSVVSLQFGISGFVDNVFFIRYVQDDGIAKRLLTILKMRDSDFDPGLHGLLIDSTGISIAGVHVANGDVIPTASPATPEHGPHTSPNAVRD